ncbi:cytochrome P450 [Halocatena pleomorpha]|uniref:Cytochrome P450 n=1 Tax=Halocatena pleomorpha TaxID=1785090 RepID=A0A3P3R4Y1_9EURY|nr:cytochrome P450 [Halocatena pleomorpha]RRJ28018.1 cytochrome P450 [Halocatena pleomorpha]
MSSSNSEAPLTAPPTAISDRESQLDPFDWYAEMRQNNPVRYDERRQTWDVFRYEEVDRVLRDHETFSSDLTTATVQPRGRDDDSGVLTMLRADPPEHGRLREFVNERFQPGAIRTNRVRIEELTAKQLAQIEDNDRIDVVSDLAYPLPVSVIAELLGIPIDRRDQFKQWSDAIVARAPEDTDAHTAVQQRRSDAWTEMRTYFSKLIEERKNGTRDDLITLAATATELDRDETIGFCILLLIAGNVTTTNLITNAVWCFEEHDVTERIRAGEIDRAQAIEEVLRYRSPVQMVRRVATEDVELGGRQITAGERVTPWVGSANRDPEMFDAPAAFRPERRPNPHLAFGRGIHFCLGAPLARVEADVVLGALLDRFSTIEPDLTDRTPRPTFHGLMTLPCAVER